MIKSVTLVLCTKCHIYLENIKMWLFEVIDLDNESSDLFFFYPVDTNIF